jgi:L-ascorbate metabolism protein UlaG (beta-lactamase superfamily)
MEIQFFGANCVRVSTKKASIVVDDTEGTVTKSGDIALFTAAHGTPKALTKIIIDQPGEYEVSDTSIQGIAARAHMDEERAHTATMFKIVGEDIKVAVVGHIFAELSDAQLEAFGVVDVLVVPVGNHGYTLDGTGALNVIKEIEPKIIIPTHYDDKKTTYEVPQATLEDALKELAMEPKETLPKLKLKHGEISDVMQLIILENSK